MKKKYRNSTYTLIISLFLFLLVVICCKINTYATDLNSECINVLVKDFSNTELVKKELEAADKSVDIEEIAEIGLLKINFPSDKIIEEIKTNRNIAMAGEIADVIVEDKRIIEENPHLDKVLMPPIPNSISENAEDNDSSLLEYFNWYKDIMTENEKALNVSKGEGIHIGIIDSGIDQSHPLLDDKLDLTKAKSFTEDKTSIVDENGHGTMVAGIIAQISPEAILTPYKVISSESGESFWTLQAIVQAVNDGQNILNMSLGTYKYENKSEEKMTIEAYERAIEYAVEHDVIVVASSGNNGLDLDAEYEENGMLHLPGSISGVLSTSAITKEKLIAAYSNTGSDVQYTAPGGEYVYIDGYLDVIPSIYTTYPTYFDNMLGTIGIPQGYMFTVGTSMAAPCITAAVADYSAYYAKITGSFPTLDNIQEAISKGCVDLGAIGKDNVYGYGLPKVIDSYNYVTINNEER